MIKQEGNASLNVVTENLHVLDNEDTLTSLVKTVDIIPSMDLVDSC